MTWIEILFALYKVSLFFDKGVKYMLNLTTKNISYMALFAAMQIVLEYCTKIFEMPQGENIAFSLVAIILCGYLMDWTYGLIVSLVCLGLHFALGLATFYGPLSVIFDYVLPMILIGLTSLIPLVKWKDYDLPIGIVIMGILKTICHLISGWYAFQTPLVANLIYNLPYNIATIIVCFVLFVLIYPHLKKTIYI